MTLFRARQDGNFWQLPLWLGGGALAAIVFWLTPGGATILLWMNLLLLVGVSTCQLYAANLSEAHPKKRQLKGQPFVSIHIPIYNEPPEIVQEALSCLAGLEYDNFEVIVLDNNTKDEAVWRPVEAFCAHLGKRFRFRHVDNLKGFKAGALNVTLGMTHPEAEYILVLDADYCVDTCLLHTALKYFTDDRTALVQFPQAYSNSVGHNAGLTDEYAHFFSVYMNMANHLGSVLSTGTVSVLKVAALRDIGGWSSESITEDVEVSLQLLGAGYRGVYVSKPLGKGLMPVTAADLKKQRQRWVFGNAQTLLHFFKMDKSRLNWRQRFGVFTQLTAWFNFTLLPLTILPLATVFYALSGREAHLNTLQLALFTLWLNLTVKLAFFVLARRRGEGAGPALTAFGTHLGLLWQGSSSWLKCLLGVRLGFERTNKFLGGARRRTGGWAPSLLALGCALLLFRSGARIEAALSLAALALPAGSLILTNQLNATRRATRPIYRRLEEKWR